MQVQYLKYQIFHKAPVAPVISGNAAGIPVLVYHGIVKTPDRFNMTADQFFDQMSALKQAGYKTITPDQFIAFIKNGEPVPKKSFLLTFDDGRKDSYYGADPILRFFGFQAVMFVATGQSLHGNHNYYLNAAELRSMIKSNRWFLESHAAQEDGGFVAINKEGDRGNFLSNLKWDNTQARLETQAEYNTRIASELSDSKGDLEKAFGITVSMFSYPFGDYGLQSINNGKNALTAIKTAVSKNYRAAFHQIWPTDYAYSYNRQGDDLLMLKRVEPSPTMSGSELVATLDRGEPKSLPFRDTMTNDQGWKRSWGDIDVNIEHREVNLSSLGTDKGAFTYLDGSELWTDYFATAHIEATKPLDIAIAGRFDDQKHYVRCMYVDGAVRLEQINGGAPKIIATTVDSNIVNILTADIGISILGNNVSCFLNGSKVVTAQVQNIPKRGGIGIGVWSKIADARLDFSDVKVVPVR